MKQPQNKPSEKKAQNKPQQAAKKQDPQKAQKPPQEPNQDKEETPQHVLAQAVHDIDAINNEMVEIVTGLDDRIAEIEAIPGHREKPELAQELRKCRSKVSQLLTALNAGFCYHLYLQKIKL